MFSYKTISEDRFANQTQVEELPRDIFTAEQQGSVQSTDDVTDWDIITTPLFIIPEPPRPPGPKSKLTPQTILIITIVNSLVVAAYFKYWSTLKIGIEKVE